MYAELHATLHNTALGKAFKPPSGDVWSGDMFMPDYDPTASKPKADPDGKPQWMRDKAMMQLMSQQRKRLTPEERALNKERRKLAEHRQRVADQMKLDGASNEEIKRMMMTGGR